MKRSKKMLTAKTVKKWISLFVSVTICGSSVPNVAFSKQNSMSKTLIPTCATLVGTPENLSDDSEVLSDSEDLVRRAEAAQAESTQNAILAMKTFFADYNWFQADRLGVTQTGRIQPDKSSIEEIELEHTDDLILKRKTLRTLLNRFFSIEHFQQYKPDRGSAKIMGVQIKGGEEVVFALEQMMAANDEMHEHWEKIVAEVFTKTTNKRDLFSLIQPASYFLVASYLTGKMILDLPAIFDAATSGNPAAALMGSAVLMFGGIIAVGLGVSMTVLKHRWHQSGINGTEQESPQTMKRGLFHYLTRSLAESPFARLAMGFQRITSKPGTGGFYYLGQNFELPKGIYRRLVMISSGTELEKVDWPGIVQIEAAQHKAPDTPGKTASRIPVTPEDKAGKESGHVYFDALLRFQPETEHKIELILFVRHTDDSIKSHQLEGSGQSQKATSGIEAFAH